MPAKPSREDCRKFLSIDKYALDECLTEQSELYAAVGLAAVEAEAVRDFLQLDYDELHAELEQTVRSKKDDERLTEGAIKSQLIGLPKIKESQRELLKQKTEAKQWRALEKAFDQRADMLKKLVDLHLRQTYGYALDAVVGQARGNMAEGHRTAARVLREKKGLT